MNNLKSKYENNQCVIQVYTQTYVLDMTKEQYDSILPMISHVYKLGHREGYNTRSEEVINRLSRSKPKENIGSTAGLFTEALGFKLFS